MSPTTVGCTVCMGPNSGSLAEASNGAVFLMLFVLCGVFAALALFGFCLVRRSRGRSIVSLG
jgi:hypothetical protein